MPFEQSTPRAFTSVSIRANAPAASGLYGISNALEWIYIGESENIRDSLLTHLRELDTRLLKSRPTGFVFEICNRAERPARQDRLVFEYEPTCNRHGTWSRDAGSQAR
jgi:hypothetical protein